MTMASTPSPAERRGRRRDFHAERVRQRMVSRVILLTAFILAGSVAVLAVIAAAGR